MGNPIFRFTLRHAEVGNLEITEPDGWIDAKLKLERHDDFHSLIEYFEGAFIFYGNNGVDNGGIDFIRYVEQNYGPDATIRIEIEVSFDSAKTYEAIFFGQLDLTTINELKDNRAQIAIIRDDFWAKFISRKDTPVNLQATVDLDDNPISPVDIIYLNLSSQKIQKQYRGELEANIFLTQGEMNVGEYVQIDFDKEILNEIEEKYHLPNAVNPEIPVNIFYMTEQGSYTFDYRMEATARDTITGDGYPTAPYVTMFIQFGTGTPIQMTETDFGSALDESTVYTYNATHDILAGEIVRIYGEIIGDISDANSPSTAQMAFSVYTAIAITTPSGAGTTQNNTKATHLYVTAQTVTPATRDEAFLIHDAAAAILNAYNLEEPNPFYSEFFGSPLTNARVYDLEGCGWSNAVIKGLQLRGYLLEDKSFFMSFDHWWKGINPIYNLGLGYDETATTPDQSLIRVEKKSYFYSREISTNFDYIFEISREYDEDRIFNKIEIGYANWEAEDISGIDDPQTKHTYATRFKKIGKGIQIHSEFIAASLAIESTRRQTIEKSKDYKFDNNTFIIAINPEDVSPDAYAPELDENFSSITNLLNSETRYNIRHSVGRNFLRWRNYLSGALQSYGNSQYKFVWGEGNYDMVSDFSTPCDVGGSLSEKENINVTTDFLHLPLLYTIEINLAWDDYVAIRDARHKAIGISQTDSDHAMFFIKSLEYELVKGKATIKAWPVEFFNIVQTDFAPLLRECEPPREDECGTGEFDRVTSDGEGRRTSDGECRIVSGSEEDGGLDYILDMVIQH